MKLAKKNKIKASVGQDTDKRKPFFEWFSRVTENHAHFRSSLELIKRESKDIDLILQSLRRDGLLSTETVDALSKTAEQYIMTLERFNVVLLRRRRGAAIAHNNRDGEEVKDGDQ